ncbi:hypothetical protein, partial [Variovorax sp. LG9.2]|uniref:ComEC/Rec2 family competence protein n=1 Tax=Variovorax sp. LG9.2 TaxID=3048626 RepID=UPI002B2307C2
TGNSPVKPPRWRPDLNQSASTNPGATHFVGAMPLMLRQHFGMQKSHPTKKRGEGMPGQMVLRIWDVEHGACAMLAHHQNGVAGRLAMIDSGDTSDWKPSEHIKNVLGRTQLDYLIITNADQDHMSDLDGLWQAGIDVKTLSRNRHPPPDVLRAIKSVHGTTSDIERYLKIHESYTATVSQPFNTYMGGITKTTFSNTYPQFQDTNNLSLATFIKFDDFKILFPGDLEEDGWTALLQREDFCEELKGVTILVASHHGRENGYCEELFDYCHPRAVVMSDKAIVHSTQNMTGVYRGEVQVHHPDGIFVASSGLRRRVLTTRKDGWIEFTVGDNNFNVNTEYRG